LRNVIHKKIINFSNTRTNSEIWSNPPHFIHQISSKTFHILQIIFHWIWEVHKVVKINGIIFSSLEF
jgi:hypothetical protein